MNPPWNSLEATKLIVSFMTPISVAILGLYLGRAAKLFEARQWANQKVVEKRLAIFDLMAPILNDLFCYMCRVGNWKEQTPAEVIQKKRSLDRHAHVYKPLFSRDLFDAYEKFLDSCFSTWNGEGLDAKILTDGEMHKAAATSAGRPWLPEWEECFNKEKRRPIPEVKQAYTAMMDHFAGDLGVGLTPANPNFRKG